MRCARRRAIVRRRGRRARSSRLDARAPDGRGDGSGRCAACDRPELLVDDRESPPTLRRGRPARARRGARAPRRRGTAPAARCVPPRRRHGETVAVNRVGRGESDDQGWFSYDDGTSLDAGPARPRRRPARGRRGRRRDPPVRRQPAAAGARRRCAASCRAGRSRSPTWSPDGSMLAWDSADGVHVGGPVPDLRAARAGLLGDRAAAAGARAATRTGAPRRRAGRDVRRRRCSARRSARAPGAGVPLAAGGAAPARARGAAAAADLPRAGTGRGAAAPRRPARRPRRCDAARGAGTLRLRVPLNAPRGARWRVAAGSRCGCTVTVRAPAAAGHDRAPPRGR